MSAPSWPAFVCPRCRGALAQEPDAYRCAPCGTSYPVVLGIPDFRLFPDPWIGLEEDREKARRLARETEGLGFEETVRAYWAMTPGTPRALAERFTQHVLHAEPRAREWLSWVDAREPAAPDGAWLDIGCGTGDLVAAIAAGGGAPIGIDIAMRWLVAARKRPALAGGRWRLACCNGEHLPFADAGIARVLSLGTLEHCRDARAVMAEGRRVLLPGGVMRVKTVNRFTLLREPHVGVWGVGFVPRRWADAFVRWRSGQRYLHHRPLSRRELTRGLLGAGFRQAQVGAAPLLNADAGRLGRGLRWAAPVYDWVRRAPMLRSGLAWVAPELDARGVAA
jgi:SAM-dependent methyltransferase/uncharacterized protein YbaR (Trm112 family)